MNSHRGVIDTRGLGGDAVEFDYLEAAGLTVSDRGLQMSKRPILTPEGLYKTPLRVPGIRP